MNARKLTLLATTLATLALGSALQGTARAQGGSTRPVVVTNTADSPVQVGNTPNSPLSVRGIDNPAWQPFQRELAVLGLFGFPVITVPAGKRLVIEFVSMSAVAPASCLAPVLEIITTAGSGRAYHRIAIPDSVSVGQRTFYVGSKLVRLYADPGTEIELRSIFFNGGCITAEYRAVNLTGYFVDVP